MLKILPWLHALRIKCELLNSRNCLMWPLSCSVSATESFPQSSGAFGLLAQGVSLRLLLSPFRLHLEGHFLQEASPSTPHPLPTSLPPHAPPTPTLSLNLSMLSFTTFSITCNYFTYLFSFLVCLPRKQSCRKCTCLLHYYSHPVPSTGPGIWWGHYQYLLKKVLEEKTTVSIL